MRSHEVEIGGLRNRRLQGLKIARRSRNLAAGVGFGHSSVSALPSHLLAAVLLRRCHRSPRQYAGRDRQGRERQRHSENRDFAEEFQRMQSSSNVQLDATSK